MQRLHNLRRGVTRLLEGARDLGPGPAAGWLLQRLRRVPAPAENSCLVWVNADDESTTRVWVANYWSDTYGIAEPMFDAWLVDASGERVTSWRFALAPDATEVLDVREFLVESGVTLPFEGQLLLRVADSQVVPGRPLQCFAEYVHGPDESGVHGQYGLMRLPAAQTLGAVRVEPEPGARTAVVATNPYVGPGSPRAMTPELVMSNARGDRLAARVPPIEPLASRVVFVEDLFPDVHDFLAGAAGHLRVALSCPSSRAATFVEFADGRRVVNHATIDRVHDRLSGIPRDWHGSDPVASCFVRIAEGLDTRITLPNNLGPRLLEQRMSCVVFDASGSPVAKHDCTVLPNGVGEISLREVCTSAGVEVPFVGHAEVRVASDARGAPRASTFDVLVGLENELGLIGEVQVGADFFNSAVPPGIDWVSPARTRVFGRARAGSGLETRIFVAFPLSGDGDHAPAVPTISLISADGRRRVEREVSIPPHGCFEAALLELFPDADEILAPSGFGQLRVRDRTARLYGYHFVEKEGSRTIPVDHLVGG